MFTPDERELIRGKLLEFAGRDKRISGAAITRSAAAHREDRWSDIDLAFGVRDDAEMSNVIADWTAQMYDEFSALHHLDVRSGAWLYRVFILPNTLQVDLAFVPAEEFRALTPTFQLVFGEAKEPQHVAPPLAEHFIGLGWLYALHARSCIARKKLWQAEFMVSSIRDSALALAALRHGFPTAYGRGFDQLPREVTEKFESALVRELEAKEIARAFKVAVTGLLVEIRSADASIANRLEFALIELTKAESE